MLVELWEYFVRGSDEFIVTWKTMIQEGRTSKDFPHNLSSICGGEGVESLEKFLRFFAHERILALRRRHVNATDRVYTRGRVIPVWFMYLPERSA